jgi:endonuclease/exonuclease/phosphatase family metal-dependent hydrolase
MPGLPPAGPEHGTRLRSGLEPRLPAPMPELTLATLNLHWGRDRSGRAYDVVAACRRLDADLVVLEEAFSPDPSGLAPLVGGDARRAAPQGGSGGHADPAGPPDVGGHAPGVPDLAETLGYPSALVVPFARAALHGRPRPPSLLGRLAGKPVAVGRLDPPRPATRQGPLRSGPVRDGPVRDGSFLGGPACGGPARGSLGLALLARVPLGPPRRLELGRLPGDGVARAALAVEAFPGPSPLEVVAAHLSHLSHGSLLQLRRLRRLLPPPRQPLVLAGDLNMWGPLAEAAMPGLRRAVVGRTWPSHRPHSQIDHVLVSGAVEVLEAAVLEDVGSDHRPVRVRLRWG